LHDQCPPGFAGSFEALVRRRERREPAGYITGHREFWNLDLEVRPGVLIPRPETEFVVEEALSRLSGAGEARGRYHVVDVGTGSGCIAVALARWLPGAAVLAIDASHAALDLARSNAARHEVAGRVQFVEGNLLEGVAGPFDAVVSNPPYVPAPELASLQPEVRDYEPAAALVAGADGLDLIRRLVPQAAGVLRPGGWLIFEFGFGQRDGVEAVIAAEARLELEGVRPDLAGIPRVAIARRKAQGAAASAVNPSPESRA
jgi:release factor glutamine methyltransferase